MSDFESENTMPAGGGLHGLHGLHGRLAGRRAVLAGRRAVLALWLAVGGVAAGCVAGCASGPSAEVRQALAPSGEFKAAGEMLQRRELDAFATNKAILFEMADGLPGARVLAGRWGLEHLAIAVPKGREAAAAYLREFAASARAEGLVRQASERAGLRGTVESP